MKKIILFTLCFITFINFSNKAIASSNKYSKDGKIYGGMLGCFDYLVKTRNNNGKDKTIESKRREMENALIRGINSPNPRGRDMIMSAYIQRTEEYKDAYNDHIKKKKDGKERCFIDCLNEMSRIARVIGLK